MVILIWILIRVWSSLNYYRMCAKRDKQAVLAVDGRCVPVEFRRHGRAKNYVLRVGDTGEIRMTMPRFGTRREALAFASGQREWLATQIQALHASRRASRWADGSTFRLRGEEVILRVDDDLFGSTLRFGKELVHLRSPEPDLKAVVMRHLKTLARVEIPARVRELALEEEFPVPEVTVRAQKTLWGSCSCSGRLSLNWKLILLPPWVRDYVIIHELVHLVEFNHSDRFWRKVREAYPACGEAERWLTAHEEGIW